MARLDVFLKKKKQNKKVVLTYIATIKKNLNFNELSSSADTLQINTLSLGQVLNCRNEDSKP